MYFLNILRCLQILMLISSGCTASKVIFFKEHDFKGDLYETNSTKDCQALPVHFRNFNGSVRSTECITVFGSDKCHEIAQDGYRIVREDVNKLTSQGARCDDNGKCGPWSANSFRDCTEMESRIEYDFENYAPWIDASTSWVYMRNGWWILQTIRDICGCKTIDFQDLTPHAYEFTYLFASHGNCFKYYETNNCQGPPWEPPPSLIYIVPDIFRSLEPCHIPIRCRSLKFNIFNDEPMFDSKPLGSLKKAQIGVTQTFYNDGIATMEDIYSVSEEVTESFEYQISTAFREMIGKSSKNVVSRENSSSNSSSDTYRAGASIGGGVPMFSATLSVMASKGEVKTLQSKVSTTDTTTSANEDGKTSGTGNRNRIETTTRFTAEKLITVPKCTNVKVTSFIRKAENVELDYRILFEVTDETTGVRRLTSDEIKEEYKGFVTFLVGHIRSNEFTAVAETKGKLKAKFGIESIIEASGDPLEDCLKRHMHSICENM